MGYLKRPFVPILPLRVSAQALNSSSSEISAIMRSAPLGRSSQPVSLAKGPDHILRRGPIRGDGHDPRYRHVSPDHRKAAIERLVARETAKESTSAFGAH